MILEVIYQYLIKKKYYQLIYEFFKKLMVSADTDNKLELYKYSSYLSNLCSKINKMDEAFKL